MTTHGERAITDDRARKKRTRLSLDISPETRRRIKIEAAKRDVTVRAYLEEIIERAVLADEQTHHSVAASPVEALLYLRDQLAAAHPEIRAGDSTELLRQDREERARGLEHQ